MIPNRWYCGSRPLGTWLPAVGDVRLQGVLTAVNCQILSHSVLSPSGHVPPDFRMLSYRHGQSSRAGAVTVDTRGCGGLSLPSRSGFCRSVRGWCRWEKEEGIFLCCVFLPVSGRVLRQEGGGQEYGRRTVCRTGRDVPGRSDMELCRSLLYKKKLIVRLLYII